MNFIRSSGILLHITSLPSPYGIGTFGQAARDFIDFLKQSGTKYWQVLPFGPTGYGDSPYQAFSAFACNPLFLDLDDLVKRNLLKPDELPAPDEFSSEEVEYGRVIEQRNKIFDTISERFDSSSRDYLDFCVKNSFWLDDYADYTAFKEYFSGKSWYHWDHAVKIREDNAINELRAKMINQISKVKIIQFILFEQWKELREYAKKNDVKIIGDMPIFVSSDCADVWANPEYFMLDEEHNPIKVAGVPPDYFSATGQLWGNPLYDWIKLEENEFDWWIKRFKITFEWLDVLRIDHFRGFSACWAVPYGEKTAINGQWEDAPGHEIFRVVEEKLGKLPIIAEDLGVITNDVVKLKDDFGFPGMKILQFAFDSGDNNPYLPHNYDEPCVVYTGTHDNDTTVGWYKKLKSSIKDFVDAYLRIEDGDCVCKKLIEAAWESDALIAIIPLQDLLCLDSQARMNTPGKLGGNWQWRFNEESLDNDKINYLRKINIEYERTKIEH